jgi:tripartite-type tricarboxylate transporter receptor subunit TctC
MTRTVRRIAAISLALLAPLAQAQQWPTKPVRFLTGFGVGGSSDQIARLVADRLSGALGQQVIVDSRPGGNSVAGTALAAKAPADGYTYLVVFDAFATNPSLQKNLPYDTLKDFTPLMLFASSPYGLVVAPNSPFKSLTELIAAAKARPGELTLGSSGIGSRGHLAMALIGQRAGFTVTQIAYRGPPQTITDVIGGQITMQMGTYFFVAPFIKSQRVRALAVTSAARLPQIPDVPTVAEQGFPGYEVHSWWGIVAPAGVPKTILARLHREMQNILATPDMRERLGQLGVTIRATTADEFQRYVVNEMQLWGKVVREAKISASE